MNTAGYERTLMLQVTAQCIHDPKTWERERGLIEPTDAPADVREALRAAHVEAHCTRGLRTLSESQLWRGYTVLLNVDFKRCAADV